MPQPTDLERQVLDNIAVGLGSRESWSGADELEWIANEIGRVRPHPGDCPDYVELFEQETGRTAPEGYIGE